MPELLFAVSQYLLFIPFLRIFSPIKIRLFYFIYLFLSVQSMVSVSLVGGPQVPLTCVLFWKQTVHNMIKPESLTDRCTKVFFNQI